jgi:dCTP deaminase
MAFWSGEKLASLLPHLITPFRNSSIDCASYILHLGDQAVVTRDDLNYVDPATVVIQALNNKPPSHTVCVNTGQFAFLLTEESVSVPQNALAFISMKTKLKFKGLINVSGFHVDPGFNGKLIFGVYNAGAQPIILEQGQPIAMIVYGDLDRKTSKLYAGGANNREKIGAHLVQDMTGQVFSPMMLQRQMKELSGKQLDLSEKLTELTTRGNAFTQIWKTALSIGVALLALVVAIIPAVIAFDYPKAILGGLLKNAIEQHDRTFGLKNASTEAQRVTPTIKTDRAQENVEHNKQSIAQ